MTAMPSPHLYMSVDDYLEFENSLHVRHEFIAGLLFALGDASVRHDRVIVEVLSPSTQTTDRREKLFAYLQISTLQSYIIAHQDQARVDRHYRDAVGHWTSASVYQSGIVPVRCPGIELTLDQIYAAIDMTSPA